MSEFLKFFDKIRRTSPMHLEVSYSKICDWIIHIYKRDCSDDGSDLEIFYGSDGDVDLIFAKAYVALKEWLTDNEGGY